jgi:hypothetical protein
MSDGPHKTLDMRRGWKRLVQRSYRDASSDEEILEALPPALRDDCRDEISRELLQALESALSPQRQGHLFDGDVAASVASLQGLASGYPLAKSLLDCAIDSVHQAAGAEVKLIDVLAQALEERALRGARQAEEHCKREGSLARTANMRARLDQAISKTSFQRIAADILGNNAAPVLERRDGLDDGVTLP